MPERVRVIIDGLNNFTGQIVKQLTNELHNEMVALNPRDTGFSANSWVPNIGSPDGSVPAEGNVAAQQAKSNAGLARVLTTYRLGFGNVHITNNVPYIQRLNEQGSTQAANTVSGGAVPAGWIERGIANAVEKVERAV